MEDKAALQPGASDGEETTTTVKPPGYDIGQQPYPAAQPSMLAPEYHPAPARMYGQHATSSNVTVGQDSNNENLPYLTV